MKTQQIVLLAATILLGVVLYFFGKTTHSTNTSTKSQVDTPLQLSSISFEEYEEQMLAALQPSFAAGITGTTDLRRRADLWLQYDSPALSAWYFFQHAGEHDDTESWEEAGDRLIAASRSGKDTVVSNNCINFALQSFERALEKAPGHPGLTLKVAEIYADGSADPMKGINMLLELSESHPEFMPAQIALGRFALVSGQFDRAKSRLEKVLEVDPGNTEAMYFLAFAEEGLGNNSKAIALLEQCKMLVNNPHFTREMDEYIDKLRNK